MRPRLALASLAFLALTTTASADDSGQFIVRLGRDTVGVERYTRSASQTVVDQLGRAPRVLRRHFVYDYTNGELSKMSMVVTPPGAAQPTQTVNVTLGPDSIRIQIQSGSAPPQSSSVAWAKGTVIAPLSSPWTAYESQTMRLARGKADSLRSTMVILGLPELLWLRVRKLGRDSVEILNQHDDLYHARVDKQGRILGVLPIAGTGKFGLERVSTLDLDGMTAAFAAREKAGAGLGVLSPRDTVRATAAGAALWIDYGRPGKRGRAIYGSVVPYGEVWRTGANAATQFRTDKALAFGGSVVPAGFYTLWTLPTAGGWKLIINSETGQWGTERKADKDLYTLEMKVTALPEAVERFTIHVDPTTTGGVLNLDWDTTRASAEFTVQP
jgi:DUF2911 family protein